ncbi:tetratricopeptide repeat protein [Anaerolineales bacterium HSG6]|nr:tetratricopeptide repeat protein [Anaerolineales bacterium HSG6]
MSKSLEHTPSTLVQLATHYQNLTIKLSQQNPLAPADLLDCLLTRDKINNLTDSSHQTNSETIRMVAESDKLLKTLAKPMDELDELNDWQVSLGRSTEAWWWHISPPPPPVQLNVFERYDWVTTSGNVIVMTLIIALLLDIAPRFWQGGADTSGTLAIVMQTVLTMITAGGILTKTGAEVLERAFTHINLPRYTWQGVRLGLAVFMLTLLLGFRVVGLPRLANYYYHSGVIYQSPDEPNLMLAEQRYRRALALNTDSNALLVSKTNYKLGQLYEILQDISKARTAYQLAVLGNYPPAYNNLAHLEIEQKKYKAAVNLLFQGMEKARIDPDLLQDGQKQTDLLYEMHKNLGRARFFQQRYSQAVAELQAAISLKPEDASAYCMLAQVMEEQEKTAGEPMNLETWQQWEFCRQYVTPGSDPNADDWIYEAQQRTAPLLTSTTVITVDGAVVTATMVLSNAEATSERVATDDYDGLNLLLAAQGEVLLKRQGWLDYHPVSAGTVLHHGDQLQLADTTQAIVLCDNLKAWPVPPGAISGLANGCEQSQKPLLRTPEISRATYLEHEANQPYIISPRATQLLTDSPQLHWNPVSNTTHYTVSLIADEAVTWQAVVTQPSAQYDGDPLESGGSYMVMVETDNMLTSTSLQPVPLDTIGFQRVDEETAKQIEKELASLAVSDEVKPLASAYIYRSHGLFAESIEILHPLAMSHERPLLHLLLADLYHQVGLFDLVTASYQTALTLAETQGDIEGQALVHLGLAELYQQTNRTVLAVDRLNRAMGIYQTLGDEHQQQLIEQTLIQLQRGE